MTARRAWRLALALTLCSSASLASAESLADIFRAGNEAFFSNDLRGAAKSYERLVEAGVRDPDVYFNLGVAHARLGELGQAVLSFERAARLAPSDDEVRSALTTARTVLGKRRSERQGEATVQTRPPLLDAILEPFDQNTLAVLTLIFDVLLFGLLFVRTRLRGELARTGVAVGAAVSALLLCASGTALAAKRGSLAEGTPAIVVRDHAELREGPDPRAHVRGSAYEGESAQTLQREGAFLRVRTARGQQGWMNMTDVGVIAPD